MPRKGMDTSALVTLFSGPEGSHDMVRSQLLQDHNRSWPAEGLANTITAFQDDRVTRQSSNSAIVGCWGRRSIVC